MLPNSSKFIAFNRELLVGYSARMLLRLANKSGVGMPVYLSFLICALSGGGCHAAVPVDEPFVGISAYQMQGMLMAPQWLEQHPGWTIQRIRCSIGGRPPHDV